MNKSRRSGVYSINLCVLAGENPGDYYSVLIVVTGLALLIKYVQITTVYSLFNILLYSTLFHSILHVFTVHASKINNLYEKEKRTNQP